MTAEERYRKLIFKDAFLTHLSLKLGINKNTLVTRIYTQIPKKHREKIEQALEIQEAFEKKVLKMQVEIFEKL